ncbi:VWA domain-containing protein [Actinokineospora inagensis]|uniref:VWA domain-containing protein n=1 Tax=Actinokineospora inagensis TaxID=103730 RepID=UPI00047C04AC|nr:VWA domain-containing protein [Actinokineospora inagensis]
MSFHNFSAPLWFLALLAVAALGFGYVVVLRSRRKRTLRFANLELLEKVTSAGPSRWRHVPAILMVLALLLLTTAMAGPTAEQRVPRNRATVMLVIDVSLSMEATDVAPTRLKAAQVAAKSFAQGLTPGVNLGLITFAGTATVLVAPTTDRAPVAQAIDHLKLAQSTATGEAIFAALQSIDGFSQVVGGPDGPPPARIVLMSDGKQTIPTENEDDPRGSFTAAKAAADKKIPITTISFGTVDGTVEIEGRTQSVAVDDSAMQEIAKLSGGDFYKAATADQLRKVYDTLGEQIGYEIKLADASRPWLILGTLVALLAAATSLVFNQRLP